MFSDGNATISPRGDTVEFFNSMDWINIFHNTWFYPDERNNIIKKRHAELLSKKPVSLKNIIKIIFRSNADLKQAVRIWGKNDKYIVNESYFSDKHDLPITDCRYHNYIQDYKIEYSTDKLELSIMLKKPVESYGVSWSVEDCRGNYKTHSVKKHLSVSFEDRSRNKVTQLKDALIIKWKFNHNFFNGDTIKIHINNILSIEEDIVFT